MGFFIAMFLCNLLMPSIMVIAGYCMYKNPPKEISGLIGYRTAMPMTLLLSLMSISLMNLP